MSADTVPGDKSISHRAVMFGAISEGTTEVTNFLQGADCLSTISCFRSMGIEIENTPERIPRAVVVVECMTALVLADALLVGMSAKLDNVKKVWALDEK